MRRTTILLSCLAGCTDPARVYMLPLPDPVPAPAWCRPNIAARLSPGGRIFNHLQDALQAASAGGKVEICPGVHRGHFSSVPGAPWLDLVGITGNPQDVVLDGMASGPVMWAWDHERVRVSGITFQNGVPLGPIDCPGLGVSTYLNNSSFSIRNSVIRSNYASDVDAMDVIVRKNILVENVHFSENLSDWAGSLDLHSTEGGSVTLNDVVIEGTESIQGGRAAADIYIGGTPAGAPYRVVLNHVEVLDNHSSGGENVSIHSETGDPLDVLIQDSLFQGNTGEFAPALSLYTARNVKRVRIIDTWFIENFGQVQAGFNVSGDMARDPGDSYLWMTGGGFHRNVADVNQSDGNLIGGTPGRWQLLFQDVDFGSGVDNNIVAQEFFNCTAADHGPHTTGSVSQPRESCLTSPPAIP